MPPKTFALRSRTDSSLPVLLASAKTIRASITTLLTIHEEELYRESYFHFGDWSKIESTCTFPHFILLRPENFQRLYIIYYYCILYKNCSEMPHWNGRKLIIIRRERGELCKLARRNSSMDCTTYVNTASKLGEHSKADNEQFRKFCLSTTSMFAYNFSDPSCGFTALHIFGSDTYLSRIVGWTIAEGIADLTDARNVLSSHRTNIRQWRRLRLWRSHARKARTKFQEGESSARWQKFSARKPGEANCGECKNFREP